MMPCYSFGDLSTHFIQQTSLTAVYMCAQLAWPTPVVASDEVVSELTATPGRAVLHTSLLCFIRYCVTLHETQNFKCALCSTCSMTVSVSLYLLNDEDPPLCV